MTRRWHLQDPQYTRVNCDADSCHDDAIVPSVEPEVVEALLDEAGWRTEAYESGDFQLVSDFCPRH